MNQSIFILLILLIRVSATQAQPTVGLNTVNPSIESTTTEKAPHTSKATEAPFYIKAYGFYSLLTPGTEINYSGSQSQISSPTIYKPINTHLGAGPRAGIGVGLIVSDFINVGIDADFLIGTALKVDNNVFVGSGSTYSFYAISTNTTVRVLSIIPNITFKALSRPAYYIYNRLGLVGGLVLDYKTTSNFLETPTKGAVTTSVGNTTYTKNSLAMGYQAALGIQFRLSQAIRGFAELVAYNQSFKPKRLEVVSSNVIAGKPTNGVVVTEYKDEGSIVNSTTSQPNQALSFNVAMNSVGVGVGLVVRF